VIETAIFAVCAAIVLCGSVGVVISRNPVHSALSLVATLFGIAVLFLQLDAQLLAAVQVIVYTGAIVVLILFVIMLLGVDLQDDLATEPLVGQRILAGVAVLGLLASLVLVFAGVDQHGLSGAKQIDAASKLSGNLTNVAQIGRSIFTTWIFAFEITAGLLTIAVIGAVVMARRPDSYEPLPEPEPMGQMVRAIDDDDDADADAEVDETSEVGS
jgi:NADH-quinone oxidoreductase subunit J